MRARVRHRFYHALVFLFAVTKACEINRQPASPELSWYPNDTFDATFKDFVNRMCQFCDAKLGGDFVTAFTILDLQGNIQYRFASNKRTRKQLKAACDFIRDLLGTLQGVNTVGADLRVRLLSKILGFCRAKVHRYLGYLITACVACMETGTVEVRFQEQLQRLIKATRHVDFMGLDVAVRKLSMVSLFRHLHD